MTFTVVSLPKEQCPPRPDAGLGALSTERGNLPLSSVDVNAAVAGMVADVMVTQEFTNVHDVSLEATYVFPLPDRAAVTSFTMEADGHVVEGVLKERGQARADYDRALAEGRRAAIAEEERPDVFTMRVGNMVPGERVTVRLTLTQPLPYEDGAATFRFPLVVAPRYVPGTPIDGPPAGDGTAPDTDAVPDASRITPPVLLPGFPSPVRLSLAVTIDAAGLQPREVRSSLHVTREETTAEGTVVRLMPEERLDRDFVLRLAFDAADSLVLAPDEGEEGTFLLTVVPPEGERRVPKDVVLVLDRSGSMGGWKMVTARRAAARIVDTLTADDRFAVLSFDHEVERPAALGEGLAPATDRNRFRAVEHLASLDARGGTEMLQPLEQAVALLTAGEDGRDRVVVLVTDGQVAGEDHILSRIGAALLGVRMHTVGVDRAVNAAFLGRLAGFGSGRCELVESEDRLDEAMEHIHRRIGAPLVTGLALSADGLGVEDDSVTHLGSMFTGVPLTVMGRFRGAAAGTLTLRGTGPDGEPWERRVEGAVTEAHGPARAGAAVRAVWARARVRALEDHYAAEDRLRDPGLEQEIVATSLRFGVLSRFTAFVAVDSRVTSDGGPEHRVIQPVEMPSGWDRPKPPAAMPRMMPASMASMAFTQDDALSRPSPPVAASPAFAAPPPPGAGVGAPSPAAGGGLFGGRARKARQAAPRNALEEIRPQLLQELERVESVTQLSARDLRGYLADLGSRLAALAAYLDGHKELAALARDLEAAERPGADLDELVRRTRELLGTLTGRGGGSPRAFWKRS
ncbi:VIT domain-containing protein [Sinosporangium siamense]|uniref:Inter-alpha-trypsin inhibitor domain-containing protein n=1 Tax=Sinosporangium siamense TaxID=1367973 RepID=A0A919RD22_9ACTN|nr:VIT domain-containing protein [Sinosporangium siamense]GII90224.1 inter-alpha-trypsin inhibitor domain-containing protein [Sinosporangium siamense]